MAWAALHLSFKGIALLVPPVSEFPCFQLLQHCSASSKSPTSCSTDQKWMTHDKISFIEHTCLVLFVNSLVSVFGDGCPVILCLWSWPVNSGDCRLKGTGQWKWLCCQNFMWTAHTLVCRRCATIEDSKRVEKEPKAKDIGCKSLVRNNTLSSLM